MASQGEVLPAEGGFKASGVAGCEPPPPPPRRPPLTAAGLCAATGAQFHDTATAAKAKGRWAALQAVFHHQGQQHVVEPLRSAEAAALVLDVLTGEAVDRGRSCCAPAALHNSSCFNVPCCSHSFQHSQLTAHWHALPSCCSARDHRLRPAPGSLTPAQQRSPRAADTYGRVREQDRQACRVQLHCCMHTSSMRGSPPTCRTMHLPYDLKGGGPAAEPGPSWWRAVAGRLPARAGAAAE